VLSPKFLQILSNSRECTFFQTKGCNFLQTPKILEKNEKLNKKLEKNPKFCASDPISLECKPSTIREREI
jgi:hypothetical protein